MTLWQGNDRILSTVFPEITGQGLLCSMPFVTVWLREREAVEARPCLCRLNRAQDRNKFLCDLLRGLRVRMLNCACIESRPAKSRSKSLLRTTLHTCHWSLECHKERVRGGSHDDIRRRVGFIPTCSAESTSPLCAVTVSAAVTFGRAVLGPAVVAMSGLVYDQSSVPARVELGRCFLTLSAFVQLKIKMPLVAWPRPTPN